MRTLLIASLLGVLLSALPVVFLGRSFVSPNYGTRLLYDRFPTLPGAEGRTTDPHGSDVGAALWQDVPYSALEYRAAAGGELPLWNRFDSGGTPLLAQGQSMFGDPLQFGVIAAHGAAWAWDAKFLLAKLLFALALGLIVRELTGDEVAAAIVALAAPFAGFFLYRLDHPAFFAFCYAPWILFAWLKGGRGAWGGLIVADAAIIASGTVKEAAVLLLLMNFAGAAAAVAARRWRALLLGTGALAAAAAITAPMWYSFAEALRAAYTGYEHVDALQVQPALLLGAFDEAFYRPLSPAGGVFGPALNFVFLAGILYFLATLKTQLAERRMAALAIVSLVPLALAFGLISPRWIETIPFLRGIGHVDDTFAEPCLILWAVLAGGGFAAARRRIAGPEGCADLLVAALLLFALVFAWIGFTQAGQRDVLGEPTFRLNNPGRTIPVPSFLWHYLLSLVLALAALAYAARRIQARVGLDQPGAGFFPLAGRSRRGSHVAFMLVAAAAVMGLLWRTALMPFSFKAGSGLALFTTEAAPRADFYARSEAVDDLAARMRAEPARVVGLGLNLFPAWNALAGFEGISGPDALMNPRWRALTDAFGLDRRMDWLLLVTAGGLAAQHRHLDFLGVRYFLENPGSKPADHPGLRLLQRGDLDLYENPSAWPRAFFAPHIAAFATLADFLHRLEAGPTLPFAAAVGPEESSAWHAEPAVRSPPRLAAPFAARDYLLTPSKTAFTIDAPSAGVAVLQEACWPGYAHATLDGRAVQVRRINAVFQGIAIQNAGTHRIEVEYRPPRFRILEFISAAGFLALFAGLIFL